MIDDGFNPDIEAAMHEQKMAFDEATIYLAEGFSITKYEAEHDI